jgi:hypothetical protein
MNLGYTFDIGVVGTESRFSFGLEHLPVWGWDD